MTEATVVKLPPKVEAQKPSEKPLGQQTPEQSKVIGQVEQSIVDRIARDGNSDEVIRDIVGVTQISEAKKAPPKEDIDGTNKQRYVSAPTITAEEEADYLDRLKEKPRWTDRPDINPDQFSELNEETLRHLEKIKLKLVEIGIEDPYSFLPNLSQIKFKDGSPGGMAGFCDLTGPDIAIYLPANLTFPNTGFRETLSHETAHFMKKYVLARKGPGGEIGFVGSGFYKYGKHLNDIYEEANAELFTAFCADDNIVRKTPYDNKLVLPLLY